MALISITSLRSHFTYYPVLPLVDHLLQQTYKNSIPQDKLQMFSFYQFAVRPMFQMEKEFLTKGTQAFA